MDLNDLSVFVGVVDAGSFTAAGKALGLPKSTVSRRVSRLERALGARLLVRTTRALSLTEAGRTFYEASVRALTDLEEAVDVVSHAQATPRGLVRVSAPLEHAISARLVNAFLSEHPEVEVELVFSGHTTHIIEEGFDVSIHAGELVHLSVVAHKLMDSPFCLVASPAYLDARGRPQAPEELESHDCVRFGREQTHFELAGGARVPVGGRLTAGHLLAVRDGAVAGHGVALLPRLACHAELERGALEEVMSEWAPAPVPLYVTYASGRHLSAAVRAFVGFTRAHFAAIAGSLEAGALEE